MKNTFFSLVIVLALFSCKGEQKNTENSTSTTTEVSNSKTTNSSFDGKCIFNLREDLSKTISKEDILKITGRTAENLKVKLSQPFKDNRQYDAYRFDWSGETGRTINGPNGSSYPVEDHVHISGFSEMDNFTFKNAYLPKDDAAYDKLKENVGKAIDGKSDSDLANKNAEKLKEASGSKEEAKKTAEGFLDAAKKLNKGNKVVEGVGETAVWSEMNRTLSVNAGGTMFVISVDLDANQDKNIAYAKAIATKILEKCN